MRKVFISLLALGALASCAQTELVDQANDNDKVEVKLSSSVGDIEAETRAPITGVSSLAAKVLLSKTTGNYTSTNLLHDGTMTFTNGTTNTGFADPQYYPVNASTIYLSGLYPATSSWTLSSTAATTADYTFDGKTDVMAAPQVSTTKTEGQAGTYQKLAFDHLLTNLIIKAEPDTEGGAVKATDVQTAWGNITSITLVKAGGATPKNKVTVTLSDGKALTASAFTGTTAVPFYQASGAAYSSFTFKEDPFASTAIPTSSAAVAYSMIAPIVAKGPGNVDFELLVKTTKSVTAGIPVSVALSAAGDTQGKYCIVTLKFKNTKIMATASVAAWEVGATAGNTIQ